MLRDATDDGGDGDGDNDEDNVGGCGSDNDFLSPRTDGDSARANLCHINAHQAT